MSIALIGLPGSGKSTLGRRLAHRLGWAFADTDALVEERAGRSIPTIFAADGEAAFRNLETQALDDLSRSPELVVATGGGVVLNAANRGILSDRFHVAYLSASPQHLHRRVAHDTKRPLLQVEDRLQRLEELFIVRDPLYRLVADVIIDIAHHSASSAVEALQVSATPLATASTRADGALSRDHDA